MGYQTYHKNKLKAWAVDVLKTTSSTSTGFGLHIHENRNLTYLAGGGQS